jgi:hypothetical protein
MKNKLAKSYIGVLASVHQRKGNQGLIFDYDEKDDLYYCRQDRKKLATWQVACDLSNGFLKEYKQ